MKDTKLKRYVVTYTSYLYAKDDKHAQSKAAMIANRQDSKYGGQWAVEEIGEQPFASLSYRKLNKIEKL